MDVEILQVVALIFEIAGFTLACVHIFQKELIALWDLRVDSLRESHFSYFGALDGADEDMSLPIEERDIIARNNYMIFGLTIVMWIPVFVYVVDFSSHPGWWIPEFFAAGCLSMLVAMGIRLLIVLMATILFVLLRLAGDGNSVIGIGLFLAGLGLSFETYQVWHGSLKWASVAIWAIVVVILGAIFWRYVQQRRN